LEEEEWDPHETYDNDHPHCLRYSIERKVTLNGKAISKDKEPEVLPAPVVIGGLSCKPNFGAAKIAKVSADGFNCIEAAVSSHSDLAMGETAIFNHVLYLRML
jgi:hypothetical protein